MNAMNRIFRLISESNHSFEEWLGENRRYIKYTRHIREYGAAFVRSWWIYCLVFDYQSPPLFPLHYTNMRWTTFLIPCDVCVCCSDSTWGFFFGIKHNGRRLSIWKVAYLTYCTKWKCPLCQQTEKCTVTFRLLFNFFFFVSFVSIFQSTFPTNPPFSIVSIHGSSSIDQLIATLESIPTDGER